MDMNHDELLNKIDNDHEYWSSMRRARWTKIPLISALRAVVELHKPVEIDRELNYNCTECEWAYPCSTIQAIEKELQ